MEYYLKFQAGNLSLTRRFNTKEREYAKRDIITDFTDASRRRMRRYLGSSVANYWVFGTLTFPRGTIQNSKDLDKCRRAFAECLRRYFSDCDDYSLFWFVEFTKSGEPHLHFFSNKRIEKGWLRVNWSRIIKPYCLSRDTWSDKVIHACTQIDQFKGGRGGVSSYALKYSAKKEQKELPDLFKNQKSGFRWWGVIGDRRVVVAAIQVDETEYAVFELNRIVELVKKAGLTPIYHDLGCLVFSIKDEHLIRDVFKAIKHGAKMLLQAEQIHKAELYRKRRG